MICAGSRPHPFPFCRVDRLGLVLLMETADQGSWSVSEPLPGIRMARIGSYRYGEIQPEEGLSKFLGFLMAGIELGSVIIFDFTRLRFVGAYFLGKLIRALKQAEESQVSTLVFGTSEDVQTVLRITRFGERFPFLVDPLPDEKQALARGELLRRKIG